MAELRNLARVCAVLAVAAFALLGGSQSVWAHASHGHAATAVVVQPVGIAPTTLWASPVAAVEVNQAREAFTRHAHADVTAPTLPEKPLSQSDCCCSGALCHGGVLPPSAPDAFQYGAGEAVSLLAPPVIAHSVASGIERPPR